MPEWFEDEVRALERRPLRRRRRCNLVLFYGSSSFTLWDGLDSAFPAYTVLNRAFGGSTLADCLEYFDRLVVPLAPRAIVLYAGDNDLDNGESPEGVLALLKALVARKRRTLGAVPMAYVSIKPSPARFHIMYKISYTNAIIESHLAGQDDVEYVDIFRRMSARGIRPFMGYYSEDPLHMNRHGYRIWSAALSEWLDDLDRRIGHLKRKRRRRIGLGARPPRPAPRWSRPAHRRAAARPRRRPRA